MAVHSLDRGRVSVGKLIDRSSSGLGNPLAVARDAPENGARTASSCTGGGPSRADRGSCAIPLSRRARDFPFATRPPRLVYSEVSPLEPAVDPRLRCRRTSAVLLQARVPAARATLDIGRHGAVETRCPFRSPDRPRPTSFIAVDVRARRPGSTAPRPACSGRASTFTIRARSRCMQEAIVQAKLKARPPRRSCLRPRRAAALRVLDFFPSRRRFFALTVDPA